MEKPPSPGLKTAFQPLPSRSKMGAAPRAIPFGAALPANRHRHRHAWKAATTVNIASGHIVEDMKLGLDLALAGYGPQFCQSAWVTSRLPSGNQAATTQRTRWEHGHLQM
jgi:cellulose synthase/poly-beta-1,6-N-acetylglucosamine synthase-like glycosyltransferase